MVGSLSFALYVLFKDLRKEPRSKVPVPVALFMSQPNGWVIVNELALVSQDGKLAVSDTDLQARLIQRGPIDLMLCYLTEAERHDIVHWMHTNPDSPTEDRKRGLTVGSALFNYSIPESFVLVDASTRVIYDLCLFREKQLFTTPNWLLEHPILFKDQFDAITSIEAKMAPLNISVDEATQFYAEHCTVFGGYLLTQTSGKHFPSISAFTENMLYKLKLDAMSDKNHHYFRIMLTTMVKLLEIKVPFNWVMVSDMTDAVNVWLMRLPEPQDISKPPTSLTLVVNNEKGNRYEW